MCSMSFFYEGRTAVVLQNLVKRFDGRFKGNLQVPSGRWWIEVSFSDCSNMNKFAIMQRITEMRFF